MIFLQIQVCNANPRIHSKAATVRFLVTKMSNSRTRKKTVNYSNSKTYFSPKKVNLYKKESFLFETGFKRQPHCSQK